MTSQNTLELQSGSYCESETDLDLSKLLPIFRRRRAIFWTCVVVCSVLALVFLAVAKRRYRADAELQVLSADSAANVTGAASDDAGGALQLNLTMQTYVGLLTSDNLALRVIREMHLEQTPEYRTRSTGHAAAEDAGKPLEQTRFRREEMLRRFRNNLEVSIISGSRLVTVSFSSVDPERARTILTQLLSDFVQYNYEVRYKASATTEEWLGKQLVDLKAQVQSSQEEAARLQRETGVYGTDGSHNIVVLRLETLDQELIAAQQNRIVKEAILHVVNAGDPEAISNLSGAAGQATSPGSVNSLALIQTLRQQEAVVSTQYADLTSKYGANYPRVGEMRDQLASLDASIKRENERLTARASNDFKAALEQEDQLKQQLALQKAEAEKANDLSVRYLIANREATSSRDLYEHLLQKLKEAGIFSGLHSTNIDVIDAPHVGASPAQPKALKILGIGVGSGIVLGLCLIFLIDSMDRSLYEADTVRDAMGGALLGVLPLVDLGKLKRASPMETERQGLALKPNLLIPFFKNGGTADVDTGLAEALRQVRTALQRSLSETGGKLIMVTSASRVEGKSTVALGLASVLARQGHRVLVMDADLRRGGLTAELGFAAATGLSDLLADKSTWAQGKPLVRSVGTVSFLPSGSMRPYPSELLSSAGAAQFFSDVRADFEYVLVDTVPVLAVTDAVALAAEMDGVLLVVRAGMTSRRSLTQAAQVLREAHVPMVGSIFNGVAQRSPEYAHVAAAQRAEAV